VTKPSFSIGLKVGITMSVKTRKYTALLTIVILIGLVLSACGQQEPEIDIDAQKTGFAQTADVQASLTSAARPTATETPEPTATSPAFTSTPEATNTPANTPTESEEVVPPPTGGTDLAAWLANDPPDNTKFAPGQAFTVTWTIENIGTSTWTTGYYIEFSNGEQMGAVEKVTLPYPIPPNKNVQISVDFVAPSSTGAKRSNWKLVNANDVAFYDFYIIIEVDENASSAPASTNTPEATATEGS
jgi:hypothetical protein